MNLAEPLTCALPVRARIEPVGPARAPALLSLEALRALLDAQPHLREVALEGAGEPLAHPRLFELAAMAAARGIVVTTSSSLLTISDARLEQCVQSGIARIDVVPASADPADFDYLRRGGKLYRALLNVRRLADTRGRLGSARPRIRVVLMATRDNAPRLAAIVKAVAAHGADELALRHLWHDAGAPRRFVDAQSLRDAGADFADAIAAAAEAGIPLGLPAPSVSGPCERAWGVLHVSASAEALPCPMARTAQRATFGSLRREGVERIWNGPALREFRSRAGTPAAPLCRHCTRQL